jgi:hypothetical protein
MNPQGPAADGFTDDRTLQLVRGFDLARIDRHVPGVLNAGTGKDYPVNRPEQPDLEVGLAETTTRGGQTRLRPGCVVMTCWRD